MTGGTHRSSRAHAGGHEVAKSAPGAGGLASEVELFWRRGYQVFSRALDVALLASVRHLLEAHVDRQLASAAEEMGLHGTDDFVSQLAGSMRTQGPGIDALSKETRDTLSGHFSLEARLDPRLWDIPRQPRLRAILHAALRSDDLYMHMPPTARFVLPGNVHAAVPPHQDISYNRHMSDFVTLWVPLVEIDDTCGGVVVYEGSGAAPETRTETDRDRFWLKGIPVDGYKPVHCKIGIGDVLLLNKWIIHASMPNRSSRTRFSIDFRFFGERDRSHKHYLDMQTWTVISPGEPP